MEDRRMLAITAAFDATTGTLTVTGTGGDDVITVKSEAGPNFTAFETVFDGTVLVTIAGTANGKVPGNDLKRIEVFGNAGNDNISVRNAFDNIPELDGNVLVDGGSDNDTITGSPADDLILCGAGDDIVGQLLGTGVDGNVYGMGGGFGDDEIHGGPGKDFLAGQWGKDTIYGDEDADIIGGGTEDDLLHGGEGADVIYGDEGKDCIQPDGSRNDLGVAVMDRVYGGKDNDTITADGGRLIAFGGAGDDLIDLSIAASTGATGVGEFINTAFGDDGKDTITGSEGRDWLEGEEGNDTIYGLAGDDKIAGGDGVDFLKGGAGKDSLNGGSGDDFLDVDLVDLVREGGDGNDNFLIRDGAGNSLEVDDPNDEAVDWHPFVGAFAAQDKNGANITQIDNTNQAVIKLVATGMGDKGGSAAQNNAVKALYFEDNVPKNGKLKLNAEDIGRGSANVAANGATLELKVADLAPGAHTFFVVPLDNEDYMGAWKSVDVTTLPKVAFNANGFDDFAHQVDIEVQLDAAFNVAFTMNVEALGGTSATPDEDFTLQSQQIEVPAGATSFTIPVWIAGDGDYEGDETFSLRLYLANEPEIEVAVADFTIRDVLVNINPLAEAHEGDGSAVTWVTASAPPFEQPVTVYYSTQDGTARAMAAPPDSPDYSAAPPNAYAVIGVGEDSAAIEVPINDDMDMETNENFFVDLVGVDAEFAFAGPSTTSEVTILDNDEPPTIHVDDVEVNEEDGTVDVRVWISGYDYGLEYTVNYATRAGSASSEVDFAYADGTLLFGMGNPAEQYVTIWLINDDEAEQPEDFYLDLVSIIGGASQDFSTGQGRVVINDNEAPTAADDEENTPKNTPLAVDVLGNDSDPEGDQMTIDEFSQGASGSVDWNGSGGLMYTPDPDFLGPDSFTYTISDGHGHTSTATVNVTVGRWAEGFWHDEGDWQNGYDHDNGDWVDGYDHDNGRWADGYDHENGRWANGYDHALGTWVQGYDHDSGSWVDGYDHENGRWADGYDHDNGSWTSGYDHDNGQWVNGYDHDNGSWVDGWNVYALDEWGNRGDFLFWSSASQPDPEWQSYDPHREWDPWGGTTWTAAEQPNPDWVNPQYRREWSASGGTTWTEASQVDQDWYNPQYNPHWTPAWGTTWDEASEAHSDWVNAQYRRIWIPDPSGGTTWSAGAQPDADWVNPQARRAWSPTGGTTWDAATEPNPDWVNPQPNTHWEPDPSGATTWDEADSPNSDWVNPQYRRVWMPESGTTWDEATVPNPDWVNPQYRRQWIADPVGGTTWDAATQPNPDWYNPQYRRNWVPTGGTTWDEADEPNPDWVNPVFNRHWNPTGNRIWDEASEADPDWVNPTPEGRWLDF